MLLSASRSALGHHLVRACAVPEMHFEATDATQKDANGRGQCDGP